MTLSVRNAGMVANAVLSNNTTEYSPIIISPEDREILLNRLPDDVREMVRNVPNLFDYESVLATVIESKMPGTVVLVSETVQGKIRHVPYFVMTNIATALGYKHIPDAVSNIREYVIKYESIRNNVVNRTSTFRPNQSFATYKGVIRLISRVNERHREQANRLEKLVDSIHELTRDIAETLYRVKMEYIIKMNNNIINIQNKNLQLFRENNDLHKKCEDVQKEIISNEIIIDEYKRKIDNLSEKYQSLSISYDSTLLRRKRHTMKIGNCFYIIQSPRDIDRIKVGITDNINKRLQSHRSSIGDVNMLFLMYTDSNKLIESSILQKYKQFRIPSNHEFLVGVNYQDVIDFIKIFADSLCIEYTIA